MHGEQRSDFERFTRLVSPVIVDARLSMTSSRIIHSAIPYLLTDWVKEKACTTHNHSPPQ